MEAPRTKKLAVFFDGTWNRADQPHPTNITKLFEATESEDEFLTPQIIHYVRGVGTRRSERVKGGGFGFGISDNIKDGYKFLVSNYNPGDQIYIFGFSRGAYTARSLAGLIFNIGILKRNKMYLIDKAYDGYKNRSGEWHPTRGAEAKDFKTNHTWGGERVHFLGVFDTVGALGAPFGLVLSWIVGRLFKCTFHDTRLSNIVDSAYHALALDERRWPFRPTLMTPNEQHNAANFEQKWFPGVHSDIGGGYVQSGLSDLTLEWMATNAMRHGLRLDLRKINTPCNPNIAQSLNKSQTAFYRLLTVLTVKLPSKIGVISKQDAELASGILWNGDYVRSLNEVDVGDLMRYVGRPPERDSLDDYQGSLHHYVIKKMNGEDPYAPLNVSRWVKPRAKAAAAGRR
jgi:uncharacterized protein (DUF2235 family)